MDGVPIISAKNIGRFHPPATSALVEATFDVRTGETVSVSGPSGSGKSTLLSILGLLDTPTTGQVLFDGEDVTEASDGRRTEIRRSRIGFVFQAFHLIHHLTARENAVYGLQQSRGHRTAWRAAADEHLNSVGLGHRLHAFPATMSGGEQQRVAIARALARHPRLLLCDEPTGNLDSQSSELVLDALFTNVRGAGAIVVVTHDVEVARRCQRHLLLSDGRLTEVASV